MKGFHRILVPVDFSEGSAAVLATAVRILHPEGRIHLLHVVEWMPVVTEGTFGVYAHRKDIEKLKALSRTRLEEHVRLHPDAAFDLDVQEGRPASVILEVAEAVAPEIIVMGTHGRSGLDHLLIGSVAERVLRRARCHVLAVRTA